MKRFLLSTFSLILSLSVFAQCDELFFSEYVEGSHNNKALEIYNPTNAPINLNGYSIARYSNGGSNAQSRQLQGVIQPADVYVVVLDKQDPSGTGVDTIVFDELRAIADTFISGTYPGPMFFNGNDAITLEKNNAYVDIIGVIGQDPGNSWTCDTTAGFTDLNGGRWMTRNHTLIRKSTIQKGVSVNPNFFNPCAEWDSLAINTFTYLGWHNGDCTPNGIDGPIKKHDAFLFPNPVKNSTFLVKANDMVKRVEVINVVGQTVFAKENSVSSGEMRVNTDGFSDGLYLVRIIFEDNAEVLKKVVIE